MEQASHYRQEAARLRKMAESMLDGYVKVEFLKIAQQYETLASELEETERRQRESKL